jgi:hypothetical protein
MRTRMRPSYLFLAGAIGVLLSLPIAARAELACRAFPEVMRAIDARDLAGAKQAAKTLADQFIEQVRTAPSKESSIAAGDQLAKALKCEIELDMRSIAIASGGRLVRPLELWPGVKERLLFPSVPELLLDLTISDDKGRLSLDLVPALRPPDVTLAVPAGAAVADGEKSLPADAPVKLASGSHPLSVTKAGHEAWGATIDVSTSAVTIRDVKLPPKRRGPAIAAAGIAAGLIAASVFSWWLAERAEDRYDASCSLSTSGSCEAFRGELLDSQRWRGRRDGFALASLLASGAFLYLVGSGR